MADRLVGMQLENTYQSNGGVSFDVKVEQTEQGHQISQMQTAGCWIDSTVDRRWACVDVIHQIRTINQLIQQDDTHVSIRSYSGEILPLARFPGPCSSSLREKASQVYLVIAATSPRC